MIGLTGSHEYVFPHTHKHSDTLKSYHELCCSPGFLVLSTVDTGNTNFQNISSNASPLEVKGLVGKQGCRIVDGFTSQVPLGGRSQCIHVSIIYCQTQLRKLLLSK